VVNICCYDCLQGFGFCDRVDRYVKSVSDGTAKMVLSRLSSVGCSGVEGEDSLITAIVGRNKEAMTILWLRKEDIDDCCE
jgi:hypothetical protein